MLKSTAGGGGIGMRICRSADDVRAGFRGCAATECQANFGNGGMFLERFVAAPGTSRSRSSETDRARSSPSGSATVPPSAAIRRSSKRRPRPGCPTERERAARRAVRLGRAVNYRSAGTVEFIYDNDTAEFYFLEVNTRLQVEHGVTEEVTGIDLVEWMVRLAAGEIRLSHRAARRLHPGPHLCRRSRERLSALLPAG